MRWKITLENADIIPVIGPTEINPMTGHPDHRIMYENITVTGYIDGDVDISKFPPDGNTIFTFEGGQKFRMVITHWDRRM